MDPTDPPPPDPAACSCSCLCCGPSSLPSPSWRRSLKRRLDELDASAASASSSPLPEADVARVELDNEAAALREALVAQQQSVQELYAELEEERNASATAASEAMSMILRLQREKAEALMESRQFRRFAEEKTAHDQQEIAALEDLLFKRDQAVQSLSCEVQAYKHRLASYGLPHALGCISEPHTPEALESATTTPRGFDYPPLRCNTTAPSGIDDLTDEDAATDIEKFPFGETPREQFQNLEQRIYQLERLPSSSHVMEKGVIGQWQSPRRPRHLHRPSADSSGWGSFRARDQESSRREEFPSSVDRASEQGWRDDTSDRVYTVDAVHGVPVGASDYVSTPRDQNGNMKDPNDNVEEGEIKKLYMRLQALEADRESMRQTIISMGTDKAQIVLLKEIAQHLCKGPPPEKKIVKKPSFIRTFSVMAVLKWITQFVFWRKKAKRSRYPFGLISSNAGLLLLLDKSPRTRQRRCITRTQG